MKPWKPTTRRRTRKAAPRVSEATGEYRFLGYVIDGDGTKTAVSCKLFRLLQTVWFPDMATEEQIIEFVSECHRLIHEARGAANNPARLKPIADATRQLIHEVPTFIPKNGFPNVDNLTYQDSLTAPEIEQRLVDELRRAGVWEWFEELEGGE